MSSSVRMGYARTISLKRVAIGNEVEDESYRNPRPSHDRLAAKDVRVRDDPILISKVVR
jgi:hypothetical protein